MTDLHSPIDGTEPYVRDRDFVLYIGDVRDTLLGLGRASIDCCVTSPPYWGLRDYGHDGQIGLEPTPEAYIATMVEVFREVRELMRDDGTLWLNLGDSYVSDPGKGGSGTPNGRNNRGEGYARERMAQVRDGKAVHGDVLRPYAVEGLPPKNLVGIPWRVALALQADGWILRRDIIWSKPNPMPESVRDRPTTAHEYLFLFSKSARYRYHPEAISEPAQFYGPNGMPQKGPHAGQMRERAGKNPTWAQRKAAGATRGNVAFDGNVGAGTQRGVHGEGVSHDLGNGLTRNARSVWTIQTQPYADAHFAVMPEELARRCILAGLGDSSTPPGSCPVCTKDLESDGYCFECRTGGDAREYGGDDSISASQSVRVTEDNAGPAEMRVSSADGGAQPVVAGVRASTVLDPFMGSGTTALAARSLGHHSVGVEINPAYAELCARRLAQQSLFAECPE